MGWASVPEGPLSGLLTGATSVAGRIPRFSERMTIEHGEWHGYEDQEGFVERPGDR